MTTAPFAYPYLALNFVQLLVLFMAWLVYPGLRPMMWRSALLSTPFGFTSFLFVPEYWHPVRIAEFICGPEDIIFSFTNGAIVWAMAMGGLHRRKWRWNSWWIALKRYMIVLTVSLVVWAIFWMAGMGVMLAAFVPFYGLAGIILWRRPQLLGPAFKAAMIFGLVYWLGFTGGVMVWPHFLDQWNPAALSGLKIGLIPLEEMIWCFGFGLSWPLFMAYTFDVKIQ